MCPLCIATAALIAGGVASTGRLAAVRMKHRAKKTAERHASALPTQPGARGQKPPEAARPSAAARGE